MMVKTRIVEVVVMRIGHILTEISKKKKKKDVKDDTKIFVLSNWNNELTVS